VAALATGRSGGTVCRMESSCWRFSPQRSQALVLWTPSGYYDASPGGEDFIGWQVNKGKDKAADFFRPPGSAPRITGRT